MEAQSNTVYENSLAPSCTAKSALFFPPFEQANTHICWSLSGYKRVVYTHTHTKDQINWQLYSDGALHSAATHIMLTPTTKCSSPWSRCMRICTNTKASQLDFALGKKSEILCEQEEKAMLKAARS